MKYLLEIILWINFLGCSISNLHGLVRSVFQKKSSTMIPLIGGLSGALAMYISYFDIIQNFWWVALLLDMSWFLYASLVYCKFFKIQP